MERKLRRWLRLFYRLPALILLLPLPAFAVIENFNWDEPIVPGQNPFFDPPATTAAGKLTLTLAPPVTFNAKSTWSISATFDVVGQVTPLTGFWEDLSSFGPITAGNVNVKVVQQSNNMFGGSGGTNYGSAGTGLPQTPPSGIVNLTSTPALALGQHSITITFTIDATTTYSSSPNAMISLVLQ